MKHSERKIKKSGCGRGISRRTFLQRASKVAVTAAATPLIFVRPPVFAHGMETAAELTVQRLFRSLSESQKRTLVLPWTDSRRLHVDNNWRVVRERIGRVFSTEQQELVRQILQGITSDEGYEKTLRAMRDDSGGLANYSAAFFSDENEQLAFMITGRHQTLRADGGAETNGVFGGPMFYGHAVEFNERPDHPGNVWWHQARLASKVYYALDGKQQEAALIESGSPADRPASVALQGANGTFSGIPVANLTTDQRELLLETIRSLLAPYRASDVDEVMTVLQSKGGLDELHLTFYREGDLPDREGVWDRWKIEGPTFAWYFRGSPHVHTWVNIDRGLNSDL